MMKEDSKISYVNKYGEIMCLKYEDGKIFFYHEDCNNDWELLSNSNYTLLVDEELIIKVFKQIINIED